MNHVLVLTHTCGSSWTAVTAGDRRVGPQRAGHSLGTGTLHTGPVLPGVAVEAVGAAQLPGGLVGRVTVSGLRVAAAASAAAGLTGTEGPVCRDGTSEPGRAPFTELALVPLGAAAGPDPAGRDAASPLR